MDNLELDAIEAAAYADLVDAAPASVKDALGLRVERAFDATLLMAKADVMLFNRVIGLGVSSPAGVPEIRAITARYRAHGTPPFWLHATPSAEIDGALLREGFTEPKRRTWAKLQRGATPIAPYDGPIEVTLATDADKDELGRLLAAIHFMPPVFGPWVAGLVGRPRWTGYVVRDGGVRVGGGFRFDDAGRTWLGMGGTHPDHRRKGAQRAVMIRRVEDAIAEWGAEVLIATETGEPVAGEHNASLANMYRCGFEKAYSRVNWVAPPA